MVMILWRPLNARLVIVFDLGLGPHLDTYIDAAHFPRNQSADGICSLLSMSRIVVALLCAINRYAEFFPPKKGVLSWATLAAFRVYVATFYEAIYNLLVSNVIVGVNG